MTSAKDGSKSRVAAVSAVHRSETTGELVEVTGTTAKNELCEKTLQMILSLQIHAHHVIGAVNNFIINEKLIAHRFTGKINMDHV